MNLTGMGKVDGRFVLLIDLDRALTTDEKDLAARLADARVSPAHRAAGAGEPAAETGRPAPP